MHNVNSTVRISHMGLHIRVERVRVQNKVIREVITVGTGMTTRNRAVIPWKHVDPMCDEWFVQEFLEYVDR